MAGPAATRPTGVTILAVLAFIGGILGLLGSLAIVLGGAVVSTVVAGAGGILVLLGLATLALSIVELALGYGFWALRTWAWQLGYILMALNVILALVTTIFGGSFISLIIDVVIAGIIAYYLNLPEVRRAFGASDTGFPVVGNSIDQYLPGGGAKS
jgi:hypothetical protein